MTTLMDSPARYDVSYLHHRTISQDGSMSKRFSRGVIGALVGLVATLFALDAALLYGDPAGVVAYHADFNALQAQSIPSPDGYRYTPGTHCFRTYCVTIGLDGLRAVPGSVSSACKIVFLGDSVTFGMGANRSYVDVLAPELPAEVVNAGLPGYSAVNVAALATAIPAEGYVWLIINNDDDPAYTWERGSGQMPSALTLYLGWLFPGDVGTSPDPAAFVRYAAPLLARDDVLAFAFAGHRLTEEAQGMGAHVIPFYRSTLSRADAHPDDAGAGELAGMVRDRVVDFVQERCRGRTEV